MLAYAKLQEGGQGTPISEREACKYCMMAADRGRVDSMLYYGFRLSKGRGVDPNSEEASTTRWPPIEVN